MWYRLNKHFHTIQILQGATKRCISRSPRYYQVVNGVPMPSCDDFTPDTYEGMSYDKVMEIRKKHLSPGYFQYYKEPLLIHQGHKQWLFDSKGNRYLDMFAGVATVAVGHCHPKVEAAIFKQMKKLWHTTNIYLHSPIHEYAEKLTSKLPGNLKVCYFVNSGTEANELAMNMMRAYTGNWDIICHKNSYHGAGPTAIGVLSHSNWKFQVPNSFGTHTTMNPNVYNGVWGGSNCRDSPVQCQRKCDCQSDCKASDEYIKQLQEVFDYNVPNKIAGFMAEPIQGIGGIVQYPKNYLKKAYEKVREHGGLCLADEVQTGFGRLGSHFWGFETMDVIPDIVTMAKGIANGFPMAAVVTTPEIASVLKQAITFSTYGGNPMACTVASATMDVIDEENLLENCAEVGTHFLKSLAPLRDEFEIVGDVRGKGLMIGIEMVTDKESQNPLSAEGMFDIMERAKDYGVLIGKGGRFGNVFRIKPPLCITKDDADYTVAVLRQSINEYLNR